MQRKQSDMLKESNKDIVMQIATYLIDTASRLYDMSMFSLAVTLQPYMKGVQVFLDNSCIDQFVTSDNIRETEIGQVIFKYIKSNRSTYAYSNAVDQLVMLLMTV